MAPLTTLLSLSGVRAGYGSLEVLHGIDMTVEEGEVVCILGGNAAGKSTLIKSILGLVRVSGGEIRLRGEVISRLPPNRIIGRGIAVVPEDGQVFTGLTTLENLKMGLYLNFTPERFQRRLDHIFALYPVLAERRQQKAGLMSGGERQMLAMARALMSEPSILILDSPSMGLAPRYVHQQFRMLRELNADQNITVILVEQNANMALALSHRGYVLQTGAIALSGTSSELLHNEQMKLAYLT